MKAFPRILVIALLFAAVIIFLYLAHRGYRGLSIDHKINPLEAITLAVNIAIALLVQYYFAIVLGNRRIEKNLLIDEVKDVLGILKECRAVVHTCQVEGKITRENGRNILGFIHRLANGVESLQEVINMGGCKLLANQSDSWRECYLAYKMAATGGSFPARPYEPRSIEDHDRACSALSKKLHSLIFDINRGA
jgi:hypothetical protein